MGYTIANNVCELANWLVLGIWLRRCCVFGATDLYAIKAHAQDAVRFNHLRFSHK